MIFKFPEAIHYSRFAESRAIIKARAILFSDLPMLVLINGESLSRAILSKAESMLEDVQIAILRGMRQHGNMVNLSKIAPMNALAADVAFSVELLTSPCWESDILLLVMVRTTFLIVISHDRIFLSFSAIVISRVTALSCDSGALNGPDRAI